MHKTVLRKKLFNVTRIPDDVIDYIHNERWLQIWVPKNYGGLGLSFVDGLKQLKMFAAIDGSFGWMITLCAGANYFSRNLKPHVAKELFNDKKTCFGGSGFIGGTANKINNKYLIKGTWHYATGAPHLSHFTLNAIVTKDGKPVVDENGNEIIKSFVVKREDVTIIENWQSMGMKATGTYSFTVDDVLVDDDFCFEYNVFFTDSIIDKIPFRIFADLTLLANYIGLAQHFIEETLLINDELKIDFIADYIHQQEVKMYAFANEIEDLLINNVEISSKKESEIHQLGVEAVNTISHHLLDLYFSLGIKASQVNKPIYQIFCDYFTATQHANFRS